MQRSTILFFLLSLLVGFVLFKVKYEVVEVEQKLAKTLEQIKIEEENIHILKAEWSHLNEPQRLQKLAEKFLDIRPMKITQLAATSQVFEKEDNFENFLPQAQLASMREEE